MLSRLFLFIIGATLGRSGAQFPLVATPEGLALQNTGVLMRLVPPLGYQARLKLHTALHFNPLRMT